MAFTPRYDSHVTQSVSLGTIAAVCHVVSYMVSTRDTCATCRSTDKARIAQHSKNCANMSTEDAAAVEADLAAATVAVAAASLLAVVVAASATVEDEAVVVAALATAVDEAVAVVRLEDVVLRAVELVEAPEVERELIRPNLSTAPSD